MVAEAAQRAIEAVEARAAATVEAKVEVKRLDLKRYTKIDQILAALRHPSKPVRLLKGTKIVELWKQGKVLARRQELPDDFFLTAEQVEELFYGAGQNGDGVLPIIVISFCWLSAAHCDPDGLHLATIAKPLEREMPKYAEGDGWFKGFKEMAVFWDWASLSQKDPKLWQPCCVIDEELQTEEERALVTQYHQSRSDEETEGFKYALHQTMDLWWAARARACLPPPAHLSPSLAAQVRAPNHDRLQADEAAKGLRARPHDRGAGRPRRRDRGRRARALLVGGQGADGHDGQGPRVRRVRGRGDGGGGGAARRPLGARPADPRLRQGLRRLGVDDLRG